MGNKAPIDEIFDMLHQSGQEYEAKVPEHVFDRIENRLDAEVRQGKFNWQNLAAYAAITLSIGVSLLILTLHLKDRVNTYSAEDQYVVQILNADENASVFPSYDIHKLMKAYENIISGETVLKESGLGMEIRTVN